MSEAVLRFVGEDAGLNAQFRNASGYLGDLERHATRASSAITTGMKAAAGAIAAIGFARAVDEALELAEQLEISSARTGIQIEQLQRLQFVAGQSETSFDAITSAINRFQLNLVEGNKEAAEALKKLGIEISDLKSLQPDEQFTQIAEAVAGVEDPAERSALAMKLFGRGGAELLPLLRQGSAALRDMSVQFDQIGGPIGASAVHAVDDIGDSFSRLKTASANLGVELLGSLSPILIDVADGIGKFVGGLRVLDGEGSNAIVNLDNKIRDLEYRRDRILQTPGVSQAFLQTQVAPLNAQIDELIKAQERLLQLGREGAKLYKEQAAAIDAQLTPFTITQKRVPAAFEDTPQGRREGFQWEDPLVKAQSDSDILVSIKQDEIDRMLRVETDAAARRLRIQEDTQASLLDITEAFTGKVVDLAQFRADFEENKYLATASLAGEVLTGLFGKNKGVAIATAAISTYTGIARALADYPWPYNIAVGALVGAAGLAQIQRIRSTNINGGGGGAASVGGGASFSGGSASSIASPSAPNQVAAQQGATQGTVLQVTVNGMITKDAVREIFDIAADMTDGGFVFINQNSTQAQLIRDGG